MASQLCEISARNKDFVFEPARLDHLTLSDRQEVDPRHYLFDRNWTLHALDHQTHQALFVELPAGHDLGRDTFAYITQFDLAKRALLVPFADLIDLTRDATQPQNVVFVFNIGRCGSTLLSKIFADVPGVWSLSEPDVFSNLAQDRHLYSAAEKTALVKAVIPFLFRPPEGHLADTFVVKFRSYTSFDMDPYFSAFPDAKMLFLWREALGWASSFYLIDQLIAGPPAPRARDDLTKRWNMLTASSPLSDLARFTDISTPFGAIEDLLAAQWALSLDQYFAAEARGAHLEPFSYRQLNEERAETVARLLKACGLPLSKLPRAMRAYEADSQSDSFIAEARTGVPMTKAQRARIAELLQDHPAHALDEKRSPER